MRSDGDSPRRARLVLASAVGVVLGAHTLAVPQDAASTGLSIGSWLNSAGLPTLVRALEFGAKSMPLGGGVGPLLGFLALAGALAVRSRWRKWTVLAPLVAKSRPDAGTA